MGIKGSMASFASSSGKHTTKSFTRDMDLNSFLKAAKNTDDVSQIFKSGHNHYTKMQTVLDAINIGRGIYSSLKDNGHNPVSNSESSSVPMVTKVTSSPVGKNNLAYHKIHSHIGKQTSNRIKKLADSPHINKYTKRFFSTLSDYQSAEKRKQLIMESGFNEKQFVFFLEDFNFSVADYYDIFEMNKKHCKEIRSDTDGVLDIYGCVYKTYHRLKIRNRLDLYSAHMNIHLCKIMDPAADIRDVIDEITHNSKVTNARELSGKIPVDFQYSVPDTSNEKNKCAVDIKTSLSADLRQSTRFNEKVKIIETWARSLEAGSILEFNLTHHLGKGIHLNRILNECENHKTKIRNQLAIANSEAFQGLKDNIENVTNAAKKGAKVTEFVNEVEAQNLKAEKSRNDHPTGYMMVLEIVGDRRASIRRKADGGLFEGYGPTKLHFEMEKMLTFLSEDTEDNVLTYKKIRQNRNLDDETGKNRLHEIFCPSRADRLHVPFENIEMSTKGQGEYQLIYDQMISSTEGDTQGILNNLKSFMKDTGIDLDNPNLEDLKFDFKTDPNETEEEESE